MRNNVDFAKLNRLCWALGSISGCMSTEEENRFVCNVIKELLNLCEGVGSKNSKAQIATDIIIAMDVLVYYSGGCGRKYERSAQHEVNKLLDQIFRKISPENKPRIK